MAHDLLTQTHQARLELILPFLASVYIDLTISSSSPVFSYYEICSVIVHICGVSGAS
jgi:hypothetical protein